MLDVDAKVNMSLDEIIKMEKKNKLSSIGKKPGIVIGKSGIKSNYDTILGQAGFQGKDAKVKNNIGIHMKKKYILQRSGNNNNIHGGFIRNRSMRNSNFVNPQINLNLSHRKNKKVGFNMHHGKDNKHGCLTWNSSQTNLTFNEDGFFTNKISPIKETSSLVNIRESNSVHSRLGYQNPAQIAYRNRVKRAKQLLLQIQNQCHNIQNESRIGKVLPSLQLKALESKQHVLTSPCQFMTGGLRSDETACVDKCAQYEQNMNQINTTRLTQKPNVNFMCTLKSEYAPTTCQKPLSLAHGQYFASTTNPEQFKAESPYKQNTHDLMKVNRPLFIGQQQPKSRSQSYSCTHNTNITDSNGDVDNHTFREVMHFLSSNIFNPIGITKKTMNDRFSHLKDNSREVDSISNFVNLPSARNAK